MKYPEVTVSVSEERITGIPRLLQQKPDTEIVLLDDAYQHRSVKPGLNILITDYARPFYKDHILPYGRLRESRAAYSRADVIIVSKCPAVINEEEARIIRQDINPLPHQQIFFSTLRYHTAYDFFTNVPVLLDGKQVLVVCAIAKPEQLVKYVTQKAERVHTLSYPDHHYFVSKDLEEIKAAYDNWKEKDTIILTTEKDAARLQLHQDKLRSWNVTISVLPVQVEILFNEANAFDSIITQYVERELAEHRSIETGDF